MSKAEVLERAEKMLKYAQKYFDLIEFTAEDAARTEPEFLFEVMRMAVKNGAQTLNIPDTVGYTLPHEYENLFRELVEQVPGIREGNVDLSAHCHNDLGVGVANTIAAIRGGATQAECTINGIGERAGNCSLEELVMAMKVRHDQLPFHTNIKIEKLFATSKLLQNITGLILPKNKPIFGDNVFSHEAGIHQDGVLKHKGTYEIMSPESIGRSRETLVMGRHSGKHGFQKKLEQYGLVLNKEQFDHCFEQFTVVADKKKEVYDEDIFNIVSAVLGDIEMGYQVEYFHSFTGNTLRPTASVTLKRDGKTYEAAANGDGPIDALYKSVNAALEIDTKLRDFQIQAVGPNHDAQVQVKIMLEIEDESFVGKGSSTDSMEASIMAYINAINRKVLQEKK
jgi:2-isopropylmalate synthase